MKNWIRAVSLMLVILMVAGCSEDTAPDETPEAAVEGPAEEEVAETPAAEEVTEPEPEPEPEPVVPVFGGTLNIAMSPADTLDPLENRVDNVADVLGLVYDTLFTLDSTLKPVPELVATYDYILDGKGIEVALREGVVFHDGSPLTGEDVAFTVNTLRESKTSPYKSLVMPITRVSVDDENPLVVRFYYDQAYAFMLHDLTFPIISKTYTQSDAYDPMVPVGTGPYRYVDYQSMQHLDLTASDSWYGGNLYVENIHAVAMNETANMETLFDQHLIDVMTPDRFNWLKYSEKDGQRIESYSTGYSDFIGFSPANELLKDINLRKAIAYAIDRESLIYYQFIDHAVIADTPVIPGSWFDSGRPLTYAYDSEEAAAYAADAFVEEGMEVRMLVNSDSPTRVSASAVIEHYIEEVTGLEVTVETASSSDYYQRIQSGDYDLVYGGWKLTSTPDYNSMFSTEGSHNYFGYSSEEMDLTLQSLINSRDEAAVIQRVEDFEDLFLEDLPFVTLYFLEGAVMYNSNTYGELLPTTAGSYNNIESLYLNLAEE